MNKKLSFFKFVSNIYNDFIDKFWTQHGNNIFNQMTMSKTKQLPNVPYTSSYLSSDLRKQINELMYWTASGKYNILGLNLEVNILTQHIDKKTLQVLLWTICFMIYFCKHIQSDSNIDSLKVTLILSPFKKELGGSKLINEHNVNSGFTTKYFNTRHADIFIYRYEEMVKVLIHELIHSFSLDASFINKDIELGINRFLGYRPYDTVNANESFTDTYACLVNIALASILLSKKFIISGQKIYQSIFKIEHDFIVAQSVKVIDTIGLLLNGAKTLKQNYAAYKESTHIVSYYILKAVNFMNINHFITFLQSNSYTVGSYKSYVQLLESKLSKTKFEKPRPFKFREMLNTHDKKLVKIYNSWLNKKLKIKSLTMSSVDILDI